MSTITFSPAPSLPVGRVRLTRRGRGVVLAAGLLLCLALAVVLGGGSVATEVPGTADPTLVVQVEPGDTLYDIAARVTTDGDVAAMVEELEDLNRLDSSVVYAGQKLRVPVES